MSQIYRVNAPMTTEFDDYVAAFNHAEARAAELGAEVIVWAGMDDGWYAAASATPPVVAETTVEHRTVRVGAGAFVAPDNWAHGSFLSDCTEWTLADYRLTSPSGVPCAVNVEVTGRTIQRAPYTGAARVRVRIEFVGDGEPSTSVGGWLFLA